MTEHNEQLDDQAENLITPDEVAALKADLAVYEASANTLRCHVYPNETSNPKAPLYRVEVELSGPLAGTIMEVPVFAERDIRTGRVTDFTVSMPGGKRFGEPIRPLPMFVQGQDGKRYPISKTQDAVGVQSLQNWQNGVRRAVKAFAVSGETLQIVTL